MVCSALMLTGCENGNLFGKLTDRGGSSDPQILVSQGFDALQDGNYTEALNLFNKALAADPDNAEALYGAAIAEMGGTGISLGTLIGNVTASSASHTPLTHAIKEGRVTASALVPDPASILDGINLNAVGPVLSDVNCKLQKIVSGNTDRSIRPDNVDVLVNLAITSLVKAVVDAINLGYFDVKNTNGAYQIDVDNLFDDTDCLDPKALKIAKDAVAAWHLFNKAADVLGFSGDQVIVELRGDMDEAIASMYADLNDGNHHNCLNDLATIGIPGTFQNPSNTTVFTPGSTDYCN